MVDVTLTREDVEAIKSILLQWRSEGKTNPLLPMDVDINGDGLVDSFGLDENGEVTLVLSTPLEETVYVSDGDDVDLNTQEPS